VQLKYNFSERRLYWLMHLQIASVAQWSERSPFTSEDAGSILSENILNVNRTQCTHVKRVSQHSAESRGFSPGASFHRAVDRVGYDNHR
jgi:hypothetical protein